MDIIIRYAKVSDIDVITDFNYAMALETEGRQLDVDTLRAGIQNLYDNRQHGFYIVAEKNSKVIGSLMITKEWSDWRNGFFWWIQSVFVAKEYRRMGIYRKMYDFIKAESKNHDNICGFRLYVEKDNQIAIKTYQSLGMEETYYRLYEETI